MPLAYGPVKIVIKKDSKKHDEDNEAPDDGLPPLTVRCSVCCKKTKVWPFRTIPVCILDGQGDCFLCSRSHCLSLAGPSQRLKLSLVASLPDDGHYYYDR